MYSALSLSPCAINTNHLLEYDAAAKWKHRLSQNQTISLHEFRAIAVPVRYKTKRTNHLLEYDV